MRTLQVYSLRHQWRIFFGVSDNSGGQAPYLARNFRALVGMPTGWVEEALDLAYPTKNTNVDRRVREIIHLYRHVHGECEAAVARRHVARRWLQEVKMWRDAYFRYCLRETRDDPLGARYNNGHTEVFRRHDGTYWILKVKDVKTWKKFSQFMYTVSVTDGRNNRMVANVPEQAISSEMGKYWPCPRPHILGKRPRTIDTLHVRNMR